MLFTGCFLAPPRCVPDDVRQVNALCEAGWYADPAGVHTQRFWDGDAWTARVADRFGAMSMYHLDRDHPPPVLDLRAPPELREIPAQPEPEPTPADELTLERAAGWYHDPVGIQPQRYWDGRAWTGDIVDRNGVRSTHLLGEVISTDAR